MGKHICKTIVYLITSHQNIQHPPINHPWISFAILINWCFESNMYPPFLGPPWRWQTSGLWISLQYTSFSRQVSLLAELKRRSLDHTFLHSYLTCAQNGNCLLLGVGSKIERRATCLYPIFQCSNAGRWSKLELFSSTYFGCRRAQVRYTEQQPVQEVQLLQAPSTRTNVFLKL